MGVQQLDRRGRAGPTELRVRLVDDDHRVAGRAQRVDVLQRQRRARRVVRRRQQDHVRLLGADVGNGRVEVDREVVAARERAVLGEGVPRVVGVHRVRRCERQRHPAGPAEGLQQLHHHLVGAVGRPHLGAGDQRAVGNVGADVGGEVGAQRGGVTVRVPVQGGGRLGNSAHHVSDHRRRGRVRVLVDVEPVGDVELRGAVRHLAAQLRAQRELGRIIRPGDCALTDRTAP